ncbi:MAG: transporter substrate-binding domain-containing protein, partial [Candidatus Methylomirabilales bacterium]
ARTIIVSILALALVSAGVTAQAATGLAHILKKGELVVGTAASMPPLNMTTKDGKIIGLEPDLLRLMANAMNVKLKLKPMSFAQLLPALEAGEIDMIMSGMTITARRNVKVAFVGPYFISGKAFLTKKESIAKAKEPTEIDKRGVSLAALKGSTSQYFVEALIPKAKLVTTDNYDQAVKMVVEDKVDAMIADYPICVISVYRFPGKGLVSVITPLTYEPLGIALPGNDPHLINWVENFINLMKGSGRLEALTKRWFEGGAWLRQLP